MKRPFEILHFCLVGLTVLIPDTSGGARQRAKRVTIRATPDQVVLKSDEPANVALEIVVRDATGALLPDATIKILTTAGRIRDIQQVKSGTFTATLTRPEETFPQLAVVAVADMSGAEHGEPPRVATTAVAFSAAIDLKGHTEPGAKMAIDIKRRRYGPVRADSDGQFIVPVVVRPGEGWAMGISRDPLGNASRSKINLFLPDVQRIHTFVFPDILVADGRDPAWVFIATVGTSGALQRRRCTVTTDHGQLAKLEQVTPGLSRVRYLPPKKLVDDADTIHITARRRTRASANVRLVAGPPATLSVQIEPSPLPADGETQGLVRIDVRDVLGNPAGGHKVRVLLDKIVIQGQETTEAGTYEATLPPRRRADTDALQVFVEPFTALCPRPRLVTVDGQQKVVDHRGIPCPQGFAAEETDDAAVFASTLESSLDAVWRLPVPVELHLEVVSESDAEVQLRAFATSPVDLSQRLTFTASHGRIDVTGHAKGAVFLRWQPEPVANRPPSARQVDIIAADRQTGVSAWLRLN